MKAMKRFTEYKSRQIITHPEGEVHEKKEDIHHHHHHYCCYYSWVCRCLFSHGIFPVVAVALVDLPPAVEKADHHLPTPAVAVEDSVPRAEEVQAVLGSVDWGVAYYIYIVFLMLYLLTRCEFKSILLGRRYVLREEE